MKKKSIVPQRYGIAVSQPSRKNGKSYFNINKTIRRRKTDESTVFQGKKTKTDDIPCRLEQYTKGPPRRAFRHPGNTLHTLLYITHAHVKALHKFISYPIVLYSIHSELLDNYHTKIYYWIWKVPYGIHSELWHSISACKQALKKTFPYEKGNFNVLTSHNDDGFFCCSPNEYVLHVPFPCKGRERREYTKDRQHYFRKIFMRQPSTDCTQSGYSAKFCPKFLGLHPLYPLSLYTSKKKDYTTNVIPMKEKTF